MPELAPGQPAPDFSLAGDDGRTWSLADLRGKTAVLYFYPKDDTPGCTVQACEFRDHHASFLAQGAIVLGVSRDPIIRHGKFRTKYQLNFPLLSDPDAAVHRAYGAWGLKTLYGKTSEGAIRSTVVIGADGRILSIRNGVKAAGNAAATLALLK